VATSVKSIGKYQVIATLGQGAHSTILYIRRKEDSREYALKVVPIDGPEDQKFLTQAQHEFAVSQKFRHPNLIKLFCLEAKKDWLFRTKKVELLIEYLDGKTLDAAPIPQNQLIPVFAQVAAGLNHMHYRGVFHADLKPNNILYGKRGEVKIIDYGLSWVKGEEKDRVQGTPEYMAPETCKSGIVNEKTDIYNFGATMYRLTTLKLPPSAMMSEELMGIGAKSFMPPIVPVQELNKGVPKRLCELIHSCLELKASKRPDRMSEILDTFKEIAKEQGIPLTDDE
jgi:serine/threonine protein kinase